MSITTKTAGPVTPDKKAIIKALRAFHQPVLDAVGASNAPFIPKMAYVPRGMSEAHIGFFKSEIVSNCDVYVEFCSKQNVPEDPERRLYKYRYNPHFESEYATTEPNENGHVRYLVPIAELIEIQAPTKEEDTQLNFHLPDPDADLPLDQITIRDLAAILLKTPCSRKEFLNEVIRNMK